MTARVGVDVGGTTLRVRRFPGGPADRLEVPTAAAGGPSLADRIAAAIEALPAGPEPEMVGVGIPGLVDPAAGTVRHAVNLGIDGTPFPLASVLAGRLGVPVVIENDVRTAALGAYHHITRERPAISDIVYVGLGTGISAGVVMGGRLHRGRHGIAGEIGHAPLGDTATPCRCGLVGCLEAVAGGRALNELLPGGAISLFTDPEAAPVRDRAVAAIARALYVLAAAYDPDVLVLGGGIAKDATPAVRRALLDMAASSPLGGEVVSVERVITLPPEADVGTTGAALLEPPSATAEGRQGGNP